jgi:hypothetical protein
MKKIPDNITLVPFRKNGTLRKNQKKMLKIKNAVTEMKNISDGFTDRPDMPRGVRELEDMSLEFPQYKKGIKNP